MSEPGYWMAESTGVLRPAVEAYLHGEPLTPAQIAAMRAYLRQWIFADWGGDVEDLRGGIDELTSRSAIAAWLDRAEQLGINPL